jgi:maleylacetoacetate isomerase
VKLYSYFRSSAAYRVRIGLNLKNLDYDYLPVNLLQGEHKGDAYLGINPQGLVPAMELPDGQVLGQSIALLEWLDETCPEPPLLPGDPLQRARVRSVVNSVACDIHPICNMSVTNYLKIYFDADRDNVLQWYTTWMHRGFSAIEQVLAVNDSRFSFGDQPSLADVVLVPQVYNARRFEVSLAAFPNIRRVVDTCNTLPAFADAAPEAQPDSTLG